MKKVVLSAEGLSNPFSEDVVIPSTSSEPLDLIHLNTIASHVRRHIVRMSTNGGCFIGSALSCSDIIVYLYHHFLNISAESHNDPDRDYFFLSKGHAVPALYATFIELGWLEPNRFKQYLKPDDYLYWHPNPQIKGIEFHSGSLGHLLAVAAGVALDIKIRGRANRSVVILGDGELNEGSNWEAIATSHAYKLDNLIIIIDRNYIQANLPTEKLIPLEPLEDKFKSFGCSVRRGNGHDFQWLNHTFDSIPFCPGKPNVIIADTIRGHGIPSIENRVDRWFANFNPGEIESLLKEIDEN